MESWKRLIRSRVVVLSLVSLVVGLLILLHLGLPEVNPKPLEELGLGKLGEMMVDMLPTDLAFTVFIPSEEAFRRVLNLRAGDSLVEEKINDTLAVLSRVMGFSAVPQRVPSGAVPLRKEMSFDSVSGFRLYAWRDSEGALVVNNVRSERVDMRKGEIVVHVMNGVIMDAEFEQSFIPLDYEG